MRGAALTQPCAQAQRAMGRHPAWVTVLLRKVGLGEEGGSPRSRPSRSLSSLQSFNAYFSSEHSRLLLLWRQVVGVRRLVSEVKMSTER